MISKPELLVTLRALDSERNEAVFAEDFQRARAAKEQMVDFVTAHLESLQALRQTLKGTDEELKHFLRLLPLGTKKHPLVFSTRAKKLAETKQEKEFDEAEQICRQIVPECFDLTACDSCHQSEDELQLEKSTACDSSRESEIEQELEEGTRPRGNSGQLAMPMMARRQALPAQHFALTEDPERNSAARAEAEHFAASGSSAICKSREQRALWIQDGDMMKQAAQESKETEQPFALEELFPGLANETTTCLDGVSQRGPTVLKELQAEMGNYEGILEVLSSDLYADFVYTMHGDDGPKYYGKLETMEAFESVIKAFEETLHRKFSIHEDVAVFLAFAKRLEGVSV